MISLDETVIVIMMKEKSTGFLEKELTSCLIDGGRDKYLLNAFAVNEETGVFVHINLTVDGDFSDEQFNEIFDCYETEVFSNAVCTEVEDCYNPTWELIFKYDEQTIEKTINEYLIIHENELTEVFKIIQQGFVKELLNN